MLNLLKTQYPNVAAVCKAIGITRQTFTNHYEADIAFRRCVDEIKREHVDEINGVRYKVAKQEKGSFDRMCVLNAEMADVYNPKTQIEIKHTMSTEEIASRRNDWAGAVDAEVIETVKKMRQTKRDQGSLPRETK